MTNNIDNRSEIIINRIVSQYGFKVASEDIVKDSVELSDYIESNFPKEYKKFFIKEEGTLLSTALSIIKKLNIKEEIKGNDSGILEIGENIIIKYPNKKVLVKVLSIEEELKERNEIDV